MIKTIYVPLPCAQRRLSEERERVLAFIDSNPSLSVKQIAEALPMAEIRVKRHIEAGNKC